MTNDLKNKVLAELGEIVNKELTRDEIMVGFYKVEADAEKEPQKKSALLAKAEQIKKNMEFNERFRDYLSTQK